MKLIEIPYRAVSSGQTSFGPLFDVVLDETVGLLASCTALLNEQLKEVRFPTRLIASLPDILNGSSRQAADNVHRSASVRDIALHAGELVDALYVGVFSSLHSYLTEYGELYAVLLLSKSRVWRRLSDRRRRAVEHIINPHPHPGPTPSSTAARSPPHCDHTRRSS